MKAEGETVFGEGGRCIGGSLDRWGRTRKGINKNKVKRHVRMKLP